MKHQRFFRKISLTTMLSILSSACDNNAKSILNDDRMKASDNTIIIEFPLRGEWLAPNTPGKRIPSHGTNQLGTRYAFDFLQVDWQRPGKPFYEESSISYLLFGVPLAKCYSWGKEIYAPCDGIIVKAEDGYPERKRVRLLSDLYVALRSANALNQGKVGIRQFAGNYVIMKCSSNVYAAFVHMQKGSVSVSVGEKVEQGHIIGKVGHSGNSTAPHLHFQLMDSDDVHSAKGIPCAFREYEIFEDNKWKTVYRAIPSDKDRIRYHKQSSY